jgi:hypothetical protein
MIAIPALTIHGFFQNRIETLACEAAEESEKLLLQLARMLREQKLVEQQKTSHSTGSTSSPQASSGQAQPITEIPSRQSGALRPSASPRPLQDRRT